MIDLTLNLDDFDIDKESSAIIYKIGQATLAAAFAMKNDAQDRLIHNQYGYHLDEVAEGIQVGKLKKDGTSAKTKIHAFGYGGKKNLARIYVPGTYKKPFIKGIQPSDVIEESLNEHILLEYIKHAIEK